MLKILFYMMLVSAPSSLFCSEAVKEKVKEDESTNQQTAPLNVLAVVQAQGPVPPQQAQREAGIAQQGSDAMLANEETSFRGTGFTLLGIGVAVVGVRYGVEAAKTVYKGAVYLFTNDRPLCKDELYLSFYNDVLTDKQKEDYSKILCESTDILALLDHNDFINSLTSDQKIELLYCVNDDSVKKISKLLLTPEDAEFSVRSRKHLIRNKKNKFYKLVRDSLSLTHRADMVDAFNKAEVKNVKCTQTFTLGKQPIALCSNFKAKKIVASFDNGAIIIWNIKDGSCSAIILDKSAHMIAMALSSAGDRLVTASRNCRLVIYNINSGEELYRFRTITDSDLTCVCINNNAIKIASGHERGIIEIWFEERSKNLFGSETKISLCSQCFFCLGNPVKELAWINNNVYAVSKSHKVCIYEFKERKLKEFENNIRAEDLEEQAFKFYGSTIKISQAANRFLLLQPEGLYLVSPDAVESYCGKTLILSFPCAKICINEKLERLAAIDDKGNLELISLKNGERICYFNAISKDASEFAFDDSENTLLLVSRDNPNSICIKIWQILI